MKSSPLKDKSYRFSLKLIRLCNDIIKNRKEYILSKQLMRAGTSIGANISEATFAQSRADFLYKMNIALKEASETQYWLNILKDTGYIDEKNYLFLQDEIINLLRMLVSTIKTTKIKNPTKEDFFP